MASDPKTLSTRGLISGDSHKAIICDLRFTLHDYIRYRCACQKRARGQWRSGSALQIIRSLTAESSNDYSTRVALLNPDEHDLTSNSVSELSLNNYPEFLVYRLFL